MEKQNLINFIKETLEKDLKIAIEVAKATLDAATNEESKPENEYDTRSLEASYLAGAQAKRVGEIEEVLYLLEHLAVKNYSAADKIAVGALIEVQSSNKRSFMLLMPKGGGQIIKFEGHTIQLITVQSPLGEALVGLQVGDSAEVETGSTYKEYEIISLQ